MKIIEELKQAGIELPDLEARWMLEHFGDDVKAIESAVERRIQGEPLSRILGIRQFWGLDFMVTSDVLDPRPDTEILVEQVLKWARAHQKQNLKILDLGTGSGCIVLSLLHELKGAQAVAVDLSQNALNIAKQNAERLGVADRVAFIQSSWAEKVEGSFDIVVSNPPYIRSDVIPTLSESVRDFDPMMALDGGADGLDAYRIILSDLKRILDCDGRAFLEIGFDQGADITRLVEKSGANLMFIHKDFGGQDRVAEVSLGEK